MNIAFALLILALNFGISWWNAYAVGRVWNDSKAVGGMVRFVVWSAAVMSACGFTWCYVLILALVGMGSGVLEPKYAQGAIELGYVLIIVPVIGSGLVLTVHSWVVAVRERSFSSIGTAAWNTYAQYHNISDTVRHMPSILEHLGSLFKGSDSDSDSDSNSSGKGMALLLMVMVVVVALCGGIITTVAIIQSTARKYSESLLDEFSRREVAA